MRALILMALLAITGCSKVGALLPGGGGPNVAANVQAGRVNAQVVGAADFSEQTMTKPVARSIEQSNGETQVRAETVQNLIVKEGPSPWILAALVLGILLPTPGTMWRWLWSKFEGDNADVV